MNASSPPFLRSAILTVAMAVTLAACVPAGGSGGGMGGMGSGGGTGGMGSGSSRSGETAGSDEDHGVGEAPPPVPGAEVLTVEADEMFFAPDQLSISAGEPVNVTVVNTGEVFHDFTVAEGDFMLDLPAGATATGGLTIDRPGEYKFQCTVPGHAAAGMTGTLIVS